MASGDLARIDGTHRASDRTSRKGCENVSHFQPVRRGLSESPRRAGGGSRSRGDPGSCCVAAPYCPPAFAPERPRRADLLSLPTFSATTTSKRTGKGRDVLFLQYLAQPPQPFTRNKSSKRGERRRGGEKWKTIFELGKRGIKKVCEKKSEKAARSSNALTPLRLDVGNEVGRCSGSGHVGKDFPACVNVLRSGKSGS